MSAPARRNSLADFDVVRPQDYPNAGLWFDRYLFEQKSDANKMEPYFQHIQQVGRIREPGEYNNFFSRWQDGLKKVGVHCREAVVVGRIAAGLGGESVIENGMTLHHTYGVPFIPGSSLKGAARAYAATFLADEWGQTVNESGKREFDSAFLIFFGSQNRAGLATFYDALPIPGSWRIQNEIMTVHHPNYYQGDGNRKGDAPADWDSPTPIPFPSVRGRFLIAVQTPDAPLWAESGMRILQMALADKGVGGKTSSGFGRLIFDPPRGYQRGMIKEFGLGANQSFGFIIPDQGEGELFVHRNHLRSDVSDLSAGDIVDYKVVRENQKEQAHDVHFPVTMMP